MVDDGPAGLSVAEAADRLGISRVALRKRLRRGTLQAYKVDGEWRVVLPGDVPELAERDQPQDGPQVVPAGSAAGPDARDSLIAHLEGEVRFLRELTEHQAGMLADLSRRVPELPAGRAESTPAGAVDDTPDPVERQTPEKPTARRKRRWWSRWFSRSDSDPSSDEAGSWRL